MADRNDRPIDGGRLTNFAKGAMGPGGGGWLNNTVAIGDNNVSMATLILGLVVISLAFGTGWIAVLVNPLVMGTVVVIIAVAVAYQNRHTRIFDWIAMGVSFFIGFTFVMWVLLELVPQEALEAKEKVETGAWAQVLDEAAVIAPPARQDDAPLGDLVNSLTDNATPDYSFDDPPGIAPDPNQGGGVPAVEAPATVGAVPNNPAAPVQPAATPLPTATPDPVIPLLDDLVRAAQIHDRVNAKLIANRILRLEPNNPQAKSVLDQIAAAEATLINKTHMPITPTYAKVNGEDGRVRRALAGGSYLVVSQETPNIVAMACQEIATIQETDGWLIGEQYQVKWCLLDQFNITKAGQSFSVPGE